MSQLSDKIDTYLTAPMAHCGDAFGISRNTGIQGCIGETLRLHYILEIICTAGCLRCMLDERVCLLTARSLMLILPETPFRIIETSNDFRCTLTRMSRTFAESQNVGEEYLQYEHIRSSPIYRMTQDEATSVDAYCAMLDMTVRTQTGQRCEKILRHLSIANHLANAAFLHSESTGKQTDGTHADNRNSELMLRFTDLLNTYYQSEHSLDFYANRLCLTGKYLSHCVRLASGHPAGWWIDYYLLRDAEVYLGQTHLSIKEIASRLGFTDHSAFGKWYKRQRNISPQAYRKQLST